MLTVEVRPLLFLVIDILVVAVITLRVLGRAYDRSDSGRGSIVQLEPPLRPSYLRCAAFLAVNLVICSALIGLRPNLDVLYQQMTGRLLVAVIPEPSTVVAYQKVLIPVVPMAAVAFGAAYALVFRASMLRRLVIVFYVTLFFAVSVVFDALLGVIMILTGAPLGPTPVISFLIHYIIGGALVMALQFGCTQLPNLTPIPLRRGDDWGDDALVVLCLVCSFAAVTVLAVVIDQRYGSSAIIMTAFLLACPSLAFRLTNAFLGVVRLFTRTRAQPGEERPPIDVIIPAFNEECVIERLLLSLDVAAGRYGGPVHVILCDDGSNDGTLDLAHSTMNSFCHASGEVIHGAHSGKSAALNRALVRCTADYVFRLDADTEAHPECFVYSVPYFQTHPEVGLVSAFMLPKEPYLTWIDRLRLFELLAIFGFVWTSDDVVDGIYCVPGTFTGFRRSAGIAVGGFVEGMYGEDVDFTYSVARLGYRAVIDTRIKCYEDVPNTQRQLRIQRTRWNRGGTMAYARHVPFATGLSGPRTWFFATRGQLARALTPFRFTIFAYALASSVLHPTSQINLARMGVFLFIRGVPAMVETVALAVWFRRAKELVWLPMLPLFGMLKHFYTLEAFLSFNPRPVQLPLIDRLMADRPIPANLPPQPSIALPPHTSGDR